MLLMTKKTLSGCNAFPSNDAPLILTRSKIFPVREFLCQPDWYISNSYKKQEAERRSFKVTKWDDVSAIIIIILCWQDGGYNRFRKRYSVNKQWVLYL